MKTRKFILAALTLLVLLNNHAATEQLPFNSPSVWLDFSLTPEKIKTTCNSIKGNAEERFKALAAIKMSSRTLENTLQAFENATAEFNDATAGPTFLKYVSMDRAVRDAAHECETEVERFNIEIYTREDLYQAIQNYASRKERLTGEDKKLLEKILLTFKRNGLMLPPEARKKVKGLKQKTVDLETTFSKNLNEYQDSLNVTRQELEGLPEDYIAKLSTAPEGKFRLTLSYPDYFPFMENATNAQARQALEFKFSNRASAANIALLETAIELRHQIANLLGYKTHAQYVLEDRMAKTPEAVDRFYEDLEPKLKIKAIEELKALQDLKRSETGGQDSNIYAWDWRYYDHLLKKTKYQVDDQAIKEYFPLDRVTEGMLKVYQELLGVAFQEIKPPYAWHPDIQEFEVRDQKTRELIGYFYMDLFPREGKYGHAAAFTLTKGRRLPNGGYQKPVSAIVANFNKPAGEHPSLLTHSEVETYFHEFGHIMHQVLTRAQYGRFSGTAVATDYVEAPSQMLENWVWDANILKRLSSHYQDKTKTLPDELLHRMVEAKNVNSGLRYLRQLFFGVLDMTYHTSAKVDTTAVYKNLMAKICLIPMSEGTHPEASFGHLMGGYDAGYYGYLWSEVFSADMFSRFEKEGVLNPRLGQKYRHLILEPGSSVEEAQALRQFLEREPNQKAFLKSIGVAAQ